MDKDKLGAFGILKPLGIETIWLVSCKAARGEYGQDFCRELAKVAGTEVIASEDSQIVTKWQGIELFLAKEGHIDDFEGTVYSFTSDGHMTKGIDPQKNYRFYASGGSAWDD